MRFLSLLPDSAGARSLALSAGFLVAGAAHGASVGAVPEVAVAKPGEVETVDFFLTPAPGEEGSFALAIFGLGGLDTVATVSVRGTPPCGGAVPAVVPDPRPCQLDAAAGRFRVATGLTGETTPFGGLELQFLASGMFEIVLLEGVLQVDLDEPPFVHDVPLTTPPGTVLFQAVPEATTLFLVLGGIMATGIVERRSRNASTRHAGDVCGAGSWHSW